MNIKEEINAMINSACRLGIYDQVKDHVLDIIK